ncbi:MAG: type II toxin-antitoxin system RelE/ParE family toxin [Fimbriiglobus sp.]
MIPIVWDADARAEFDDGLSVSADPARFRADVDAVVARIAVNPQCGARVGRYRVREYIFTRLPYSLIYGEGMLAVRIVAFAHQKRRPGYWISRLRRA